MINIKIVKFPESLQHAVVIEEFEPKDGLENFLIGLSIFLNENLLDWHRSWEFGIGHMTYDDYVIRLCQSEFPFEFSFDCRDEAMALDLKIRLSHFYTDLKSLGS